MTRPPGAVRQPARCGRDGRREVLGHAPLQRVDQVGPQVAGRDDAVDRTHPLRPVDVVHAVELGRHLPEHLGADGRPHVVPVCFALDGDTLYTAVDEKPKSTRRLRRLANIEANPQVELVVDHWDEDWSRLWWVRLAGRAEIVERDERALELLQAK